MWKHNETISGGWYGADVEMSMSAELFIDEISDGESAAMTMAYVKFVKEMQEKFRKFEAEMLQLYPFKEEAND
jgi:hypothetical protein